MADRFPKRSLTRSPFFTTNGAVPGKAFALMVRTLKSLIVFGFGRDAPAGMCHSLSIIAKSRWTL